MEVICLEEAAFYSLLDKVYAHLKTVSTHHEDKWILPEAAMEMLGVKKTKLQDLRNTGEVIFSQPSKKVILYDADSIREYLDRHTRKF
ncbi:MAG TPA: helix-turn-helix domain-containing protein [Mucilaginibacter sp.]|nr:helix-turn-helix domain-containing protein [Mucilaginibacter sp.]